MTYNSENIRKWLLKECLRASDPEEFWNALYNVVDEIQAEIDNGDIEWDELINER